MMETCFVCKRENPKSCSHCHNICYCSKECQKSDWKRHKIECSQTIRFHGNGGVNIPLNISFNPTKQNPSAVAQAAAACPSFICTEIPGKGEGLIATRDINYGELIIEEYPIMETGPLPLQKEKDLKKIFKKLSDEERETILAMHDAFERDGKKTLLGIVNTNSFAR